jgi:predicted ribosomally synthesized peptide with nif11-like leader
MEKGDANMSKEVAIQFLKTVDQSPELQRQLKPLENQPETPEKAQKLVQVAEKAGYKISADDLKSAIRSHNEHLMQVGELSEQDLEKVAGGLAADWCICTDSCCFTKCFWSSAFATGA